jgi:hypothetical protein
MLEALALSHNEGVGALAKVRTRTYIGEKTTPIFICESAAFCLKLLMC